MCTHCVGWLLTGKGCQEPAPGAGSWPLVRTAGCAIWRLVDGSTSSGYAGVEGSGCGDPRRPIRTAQRGPVIGTAIPDGVACLRGLGDARTALQGVGARAASGLCGGGVRPRGPGPLVAVAAHRATTQRRAQRAPIFQPPSPPPPCAPQGRVPEVVRRGRRVAVWRRGSALAAVDAAVGRVSSSNRGPMVPRVVGRRAAADCGPVDRPAGSTTGGLPRTRNRGSSQRGGVALDSFRLVDRDRGRRRRRSQAAGACDSPGRRGNALHLVGRFRADGSRGFDAAPAPGRRARVSREGPREHRPSCRIRPRRASIGRLNPAEDVGMSGGTAIGPPPISHFL